MGEVGDDSFTLELNGASSAKIAGKTRSLTLEMSGASSCDAQKMNARKVAVEASGASHAELGAPDELDATASGASSVVYGGSPEVSQNVSGASTIKQR